MKILLVDCSPKKRLSTSSYLLSHLSGQLTGQKEKIKLLPKNYDSICQKMKEVDSVVFALPIYVDGVPASVLRFFEYFEQFRSNGNFPAVKIYAIVNCGFYEGKQTSTCHRIIENWCNRCGLSYMGGIGQGAGEMIGVIRFVNPFIAIVGSLIQFIIHAIIMGDQFTFIEACKKVGWINIAINIGLYFVFNIFMYIAVTRLARRVRKAPRQHQLFIPRFFALVFCSCFLPIFFGSSRLCCEASRFGR